MKSDARIRYTKLRIKDAFLSCLKEKPVNKVTVKEICELAEINRSTFYTHYSDPFDLFEQLENEAIEALRNFIEGRLASGGDILPVLIEGIDSEEARLGWLASENGDPGFMSRVSDIFYDYYLGQIADALPGADDATRTELYRYISAGSGSLIAGWVADGKPTSTQELAERISSYSRALLEAM